MFHEETVLQYTKEKLLANECNKKRFIELLTKALQKANICVQQAVEDADLTIVNSAISVAPQYDYVRVVAPESLLQCISCTCKKSCTNACGCRKAGLHCSLLCTHCIGQSCENPMPVILDNESEEGDAPAPIYMVDEQLECEDIEL
ncbi:hypothetical protein AVEN_179551-1 [Araneus ventricosus]|uniref:Tesmin/TSO1-like CXC domain-containing protein n=1 Tax=Araneus ventricosus TaxID=182803 RepID=A0A4Y2H8W6_ARAVE|nr:hypothetical protein AVEN_179551-1 [Araneus ventricosus]